MTQWSPEKRELFEALCAMEQELDPQFQEAFTNFMRMVGK